MGQPWMHRRWRKMIVTIFDSQNIKSKDVATSVSGHSVIVKRVSMPIMSEEELYDRVQTEASQHIPFDIADVNLSYQLLEATENQMDVLLVAVKKDKILNHTNVLAQAGKTPMVVDIDAFALQNSFELNYDPDPAQVVALLNVGASVMNINIIRGYTPLFTRDVSVGGNQYTDALQKELDLSFEDAGEAQNGRNSPGRKRGTAHGHPAVGFGHSDPRNSKNLRLLLAPAAKGERTFAGFTWAGGTARVPGLPDPPKRKNLPCPSRTLSLSKGLHSSRAPR